MLHLACLAIYLCVCAGEPWQPAENPYFLLRSEPIRKLQALPRAGAARQAWSDDYWPNYKGGIARRWQASPQVGHGYALYSPEQLQTMSLEQRNTLSPAEKYDILMGRFDYPTIHNEWKRARPTSPHWEGLCHGWAAASLCYEQPKPVEVGVQHPNFKGSIKFASSDIKALLIYYAGRYRIAEIKVHGVGVRCNKDLTGMTPQMRDAVCKGINPGAFHVAVANTIGLLKKPAIIDVDRGIQVWNQPIVSFSSEMGPVRDVGARKEVDVTMKLTYVLETQPNTNPHSGLVQTKTYRYILEINPSGDIDGGRWLQEERPDFLWVAACQDALSFTGYFAGLESLYRQSMGTISISLAPQIPWILPQTPSTGLSNVRLPPNTDNEASSLNPVPSAPRLNLPPMPNPPRTGVNSPSVAGDLQGRPRYVLDPRTLSIRVETPWT